MSTVQKSLPRPIFFRKSGEWFIPRISRRREIPSSFGIFVFPPLAIFSPGSALVAERCQNAVYEKSPLIHVAPYRISVWRGGNTPHRAGLGKDENSRLFPLDCMRHTTASYARKIVMETIEDGNAAKGPGRRDREPRRAGREGSQEKVSGIAFRHGSAEIDCCIFYHIGECGAMTYASIMVFGLL